MAKDHKYHFSRLEADTALSVKDSLGIARRVLETQKSLSEDSSIDDGFVVLMKSWVGMKIMHFSVTAAAFEGRTRVSTELLQYSTSQSTVYFVPIGPKTIEGYSIYRSYMRALGEALTAADPSTLFAVIEMGAGGGLFDASAAQPAPALPATPAQPAAPAQPVSPTAPEPEPHLTVSPGEAARLVVDALTTPQQLSDIAALYPALHPYVRAHPNCYPALIQWLDSVSHESSESSRT